MCRWAAADAATKVISGVGEGKPETPDHNLFAFLLRSFIASALQCGVWDESFLAMRCENCRLSADDDSKGFSSTAKRLHKKSQKMKRSQRKKNFRLVFANKAAFLFAPCFVYKSTLDNFFLFSLCLRAPPNELISYCFPSLSLATKSSLTRKNP